MSLGSRFPRPVGSQQLRGKILLSSGRRGHKGGSCLFFQRHVLDRMLAPGKIGPKNGISTPHHLRYCCASAVGTIVNAVATQQQKICETAGGWFPPPPPPSLSISRSPPASVSPPFSDNHKNIINHSCVLPRSRGTVKHEKKTSHRQPGCKGGEMSSGRGQRSLHTYVHAYNARPAGLRRWK